MTNERVKFSAQLIDNIDKAVVNHFKGTIVRIVATVVQPDGRTTEVFDDHFTLEELFSRELREVDHLEEPHPKVFKRGSDAIF